MKVDPLAQVDNFLSPAFLTMIIKKRSRSYKENFARVVGWFGVRVF